MRCRDVRHSCRSSAGTAIGVGGTVTTLAALDLGLETYDPGASTGTCSRAAVDALDRLAAPPLDERRACPGSSRTARR